MGLLVATALLACRSDEQGTLRDQARSTDTTRGEWPVYGGDPAGHRYAALADISADGFSHLDVAWTWDTGGAAWRDDWMARHGVKRVRHAPSLAGFQLTPIVVDGVMYGVDAVGVLFALDAATGAPIWTHAGDSLPGPGSGRSYKANRSRGVSYWRDGDDERIVFATFDGHLIEVDAATGVPIPSFGHDGRIDLADDLRNATPELIGDFYVTSPVVVHGDTIVVGGSIFDRPVRLPGLADDLRAYDVRTGALRWTFPLVPTADDPATATWQDESWRVNGSANAWAPKTVDHERGWIYVGTSAPTSDYYGGARPGDNLYADSLLCIDIGTGELIWHFQVTHHGVWDYDLAAPPNLVDIEVDGEPLEAVALATKQGFVFVLDRVTGEPVWPVEERAVPASTLDGEALSPTQPFPTRPPPFERQGLSVDDLVDWTPELRQAALDQVGGLRFGPLYSPPAAERTIFMPGAQGGANWSGAAVDPETGVMYVPSIGMPMVLGLTEPPPGRSDFRYLPGLPVPLAFVPPAFPDDWLPAIKPPYSQVTAIDLNSGEILWQTPLGDGFQSHPALVDLDVPPTGSGAFGCALVTPTLVLVTEGTPKLHPAYTSAKLWAFDKRTGEVRGQHALPATPTGCPMAYRVRDDTHIAVATATKPAATVLVLRAPK